MSCYKHLTTEERECILVFLAKGYSKRKIAEELSFVTVPNRQA